MHGLKPVENRSWKTKLRGRVLIHAGKKFDQAGFEWLLENKLIPVESKKDQFLFGGIVGEAEIVDCVEDLDSIWFFRPLRVLIRKRGESIPLSHYEGSWDFLMLIHRRFEE